MNMKLQTLHEVKAHKKVCVYKCREPGCPKAPMSREREIQTVVNICASSSYGAKKVEKSFLLIAKLSLEFWKKKNDDFFKIQENICMVLLLISIEFFFM